MMINLRTVDYFRLMIYIITYDVLWIFYDLIGLESTILVLLLPLFPLDIIPFPLSLLLLLL